MTGGLSLGARTELGVVKKLYVGNLPYRSTETEIRELFEKLGTVHSVTLITDKETGRPRGFGFVEMEASAADAAISALNGTVFGGRNLRVDFAKERGEGRRESGSSGSWMR